MLAYLVLCMGVCIPVVWAMSGLSEPSASVFPLASPARTVSYVVVCVCGWPHLIDLLSSPPWLGATFCFVGLDEAGGALAKSLRAADVACED